MTTRRVFKNEKVQNLILQDCNAEEIEFPDLEEDDFPSKGDSILIDGKKETGERLMPNCTLIEFKDGIVTKITHDEETEQAGKVAACKKINDSVCKTFNVWKNNQNQKIEILGNNAATPFRKGNRVMVNGKNMKLGTYAIGNKQMKISNGRISEVTVLNAKTPGTRSVMKSKGKKMIGFPVKKTNSENEQPKTRTKDIPKPAKSEERMVFMKRINASNVKLT